MLHMCPIEKIVYNCCTPMARISLGPHHYPTTAARYPLVYNISRHSTVRVDKTCDAANATRQNATFHDINNAKKHKPIRRTLCRLHAKDGGKKILQASRRSSLSYPGDPPDTDCSLNTTPKYDSSGLASKIENQSKDGKKNSKQNISTPVKRLNS